MKHQRTALNLETRETPKSSLRAYASVAVFAAGLAILPSCATAKIQEPIEHVQTQEFRKGDLLFKTQYDTDPPASVELNAGNIDGRGVEIVMTIFMLGSMPNNPWRVNYGEMKDLPVSSPLFRISAERGKTPGTARISVEPIKSSDKPDNSHIF